MISKRQIVMFLSACMAATALLGGCSGKGDTLSVMSFNVRYGTAKDGDNVWEIIRYFNSNCLRTL